MKYFIVLSIMFVSNIAQADIETFDFEIDEVQVRSGNYYASEWDNVVTLAVSPKVSFDSCNPDRVYFFSTTDSALLSVALSAQAQKSKVALTLNNSAEKKDGICKVEVVSIK